MDESDKSKEVLIEELQALQKSFNSLKEKAEKTASLLKLLEKKKGKGEEIINIAFATSPDSINLNRLSDGMYISINKGFTNIMGYSWEDVIGKTSLELNIWNDPEFQFKGGFSYNIFP
jgi:hypothetical protein